MTDAITREEKLLAGIAIEPITREEMFLAKAGGQDVQTPEPITRREKLLQGIIDNGGGGGSTGGGSDFVGIKYSDFTGNRGTPKVADASSLFLDGYTGQTFGGYPYLFANTSTSPNGGWNTGLETVYIPKEMELLQFSMFNNCANLKKVHNTENVKSVKQTCFANCKNLVDFPYFPQLEIIDNNAFQNCVGLTNVKLFNSEGVTLSSSSFNGCTNITDIYVPWAEGAVKNAPWGATNATIHYNTTYDENHEPIV